MVTDKNALSTGTLEREISVVCAHRKLLLQCGWLAVVLQCVHVFVLLFLKHPLIASNVIQVSLPFVAVIGCLVRRLASSERQSRLWGVLCAAFLIWSLAEVAYLVELYLLPPKPGFTHVDDVLWLFFAVPLLLVLSGCLEGKLSRISRLDQAQAILAFVVVSVMVFSRHASISFNQGYDVENLTLLFSCIARYSISRTRRDRILFRGLGIYLSIYFVCAGIGNFLSERGFALGSMVDLFWSIPITTFCVANFLLPQELLLHRETDREHDSPHTWSRHMHDLSALGLAGLSMAASAYLVYGRPVLGSFFLAISFAVLAARTYGRSVDLHRANDSLRDSLLTDSLTGLGNRARLRAELIEPKRGLRRDPDRPFRALLFLDLDRFKAINDGLGHAAGDFILVELGRRIRETLQPPAVSCRLGGDEFVILLPVKDRQEGEAYAARLMEAIRAPLLLAGKMLQLSASVGLVFDAQQDEADDLLRKADQAMYEAKRRGKNRIHGFDPALAEKASTYNLETDLRECLRRRELEVYLQPIYGLSRGEVSGFEALARWTHPMLGSIPPSTFVPLAEECGAILDLGRQMLTGAIETIAQWNQSRGASAWASVNVSVVQLTDLDFLPFVLETLARTGLDAHLLHLEITESVMLSEDKACVAVLSEARRHGIHVSLDDFGTGYSSLSYLLNFPTDEIKIDRGFIRGMDKDALRMKLVRTVLHLGESLNKRVIAEGVETESELSILKSLGVEYVQGYLLGRPMPSVALQSMAGRHELILNDLLKVDIGISPIQ